MKILTWNCNGAFRKKFQEIKDINADIYVIQEAENPISVPRNQKDYHNFVKNYYYKAYNKKGVLVIVKNLNVQLKENSWNDLCFIGYVHITINNNDFTFLWTHENHIEDLCSYVRTNYNKISTNTIIVGDFNSSVLFNSKNGRSKYRNHTAFNELLKPFNIVSAYHYYFNEEYGNETFATQYMYRHLDKTYHIDYCYCYKNKIDKVILFDKNKYLQFSDHIPLLFELKE